MKVNAYHVGSFSVLWQYYGLVNLPSPGFPPLFTISTTPNFIQPHFNPCLMPPPETRNTPRVRTSTKEICLTVLPSQGWTWSGQSLFRKNRGNGNSRMLALPASRADSTSLVHQMYEMAGREKSSLKKSSEHWVYNRMATPT